MSEYSRRPLDFAGSRTVGPRERSKAKIADLVAVFQKFSRIAGWLDSQPHILRLVQRAASFSRWRQYRLKTPHPNPSLARSKISLPWPRAERSPAPIPPRFQDGTRRPCRFAWGLRIRAATV